MSDRYRVESPDEMLDFFMHAADELHRYIGRLTGGDESLTEDIVQESFISLLRHHREGDDATMHIGWLMTTARHRLIDHVRSSQREQARIDRHVVGEKAYEPPLDLGTVSAEHARWMLAQLPLHERVALSLHTLDGRSVAEVASMLGRSTEATTSLLARARRRLRAVMVETADEQ